MGSHRGTPPPPPRWWFWGVVVSGEGIRRWGIEGIRIGTSDRFGRGRGEFQGEWTLWVLRFFIDEPRDLGMSKPD